MGFSLVMQILCVQMNFFHLYMWTQVVCVLTLKDQEFKELNNSVGMWETLQFP